MSDKRTLLLAPLNQEEMINTGIVADVLVITKTSASKAVYRNPMWCSDNMDPGTKFMVIGSEIPVPGRNFTQAFSSAAEAVLYMMLLLKSEEFMRHVERLVPCQRRPMARWPITFMPVQRFTPPGVKPADLTRPGKYWEVVYDSDKEV